MEETPAHLRVTFQTFLVWDHQHNVPIAIAGTMEAAQELADALNDAMGSDVYDVDQAGNRGMVPNRGWARDADNLTFTKESD